MVGDELLRVLDQIRANQQAVLERGLEMLDDGKMEMVPGEREQFAGSLPIAVGEGLGFYEFRCRYRGEPRWPVPVPWRGRP